MRSQGEQNVQLSDLAFHFEYDRSTPSNIQERKLSDRNGVQIHDLSYQSPLGGSVPAYLVVPPGTGPFAVVLYGHWMMHGSPLMNRKEFLEEAILLARSGVLCLLIDAPFVRAGFVEDEDILRSAIQAAETSRQQVIDFRRGLDWLLSRPDINASRVAYVGHSFDAHVGAILAAVEKRIQTFVLMAGSYADERNTLQSTDARVVGLRQRVGENRMRQYFHDYKWDDPVHFLPYSSPASVFLQFGNHDHLRAQDLNAFDEFGKPKRIEFYAAGHALNAMATTDRVMWLQERLRLNRIDSTDLKNIPEIK